MATEYTHSQCIADAVKVRAYIMATDAFHGACLWGMTIDTDETLTRTACVTHTHIFINPKFFAALTFPERVTLMCHEVEHPMLGHLGRAKNFPPDIRNAGGDFLINDNLKKMGKAPIKGWLLDPTYTFKDWSLEQVCADLMKKAKAHKQQQQKGGGKGQPQQGQGADSDPCDEGDEGEGQPQSTTTGGSKPPAKDGGKGQSKGQPDEITSEDFAKYLASRGMQQNDEMRDEKDFEPVDPKEAEELAEQWRQRMMTAVRAAKAAGQLPAGMERFIEEATAPKVNPADVLRQFLVAAANDERSYRRVNRRALSRGDYLPAQDGMKCPPIVVAGDTSGSMGDEELAIIKGWVQAVIEECHPEKIYMVWADAAVAGVQEIDSMSDFELHPKGGGGTDFRPVFRYIEEELEDDPCVLVYITDLYGDFPAQAPAIPTVWISTVHGAKAPFGVTVDA